MYKTVDHSQHSFLDFNQPLGLHMNPENRWIKMADSIPWDVFEEKYARKFRSHDRQCCQNSPYYQYCIAKSKNSWFLFRRIDSGFSLSSGQLNG